MRNAMNAKGLALAWFFLMLLAWPTAGVPAWAAGDDMAAATMDWRPFWNPQVSNQWLAKSEAELSELASQGRPEAQFFYWKKFRRGQKQRAAAMLEAAANQGFTPALYERGFDAFLNLQTSPEQRLEGWSRMLKAAQDGFLPAKLTVASYETGRTTCNDLVQPNLKRALNYLRDCADGGYAEAKADLALLYSSGVGEPRSTADTPHQLLLAAARAGSTEAMRHLSDRYALAHGETYDPLEAARYRYMADRGESLLDGDGKPVAQNTPEMNEMVETVSLIYRAVRSRDSGAANALGQRFLKGGKAGLAVAWLRIAKAAGSVETAAELAKLESTLTPEQRDQAARDPLTP